MEMIESRQGNILVLSVKGSLDVITSVDLEKKLTEWLDAGGKALVLDLTNLDYVSSAGLRVFMLVLKRLKKTGGHVRFCALTKPVKQIFDIAGLTFRVEIMAALPEALANFPAT